MNKFFNIISYKGLSQGTAELCLNACRLATSVFGNSDEDASECLRALDVYDDARPMFSSYSPNSVADSSVIATAFAQDRSTGRGNILNIQDITPVPSTICNNSGFRAGFRCPDPVQAEHVAKLLGSKDLAPIIQALPDRHYFAWADGFEHAILLKSPDMPLGPSPDQAFIDSIMNPILEEIESSLVLSPPFEDNVIPICYLEDNVPVSEEITKTSEAPLPDDPGILADYVRFMRTIVTNDNLSSRELVAAVGMNASKTTKIKTELSARGYITTQKVPGVNGRPRIVVELTTEGLDLLNSWEGCQ